MKSIKLTGIRKMEMTEVPMPEIINEHDVLIKMKTLGVCGSDIHYYISGRINDQIVKYPFAVGHEGAGVVEKIGKAVSRVKPGDKIAIDPAMPCLKCSQCKSGRQHTCENLKFLGCPGQAEGCLSEYMVMPEHSCFKISQNMSFDQAALSEPLSIGLYATKISVPLKNTNMGILGFGPIGMSVLLAAQLQNPMNIYVSDKINERLQIAKNQGAKLALNPDKENIVKQITEDIPGLLDVVFECCGKQEAVDQAIDLLKPGGKLMIIGIPDFDTWTFNVEKLRRKEINIQNVRRQNNSVQETLDYLNSGKINVDKMPTHRFHFKDTQKAFDLVAGYKDGVMKAMIDFD
jgi:L-iditol 2-dehydrogenase